jgi:hypothetical protein
MRALLLKDVKAGALLIAAVVVLYALTSVAAARAEEALFWLSVGLAVGLWIMPPLVDWRVDADHFICSLPVDRAPRGCWPRARPRPLCG